MLVTKVISGTPHVMSWGHVIALAVHNGFSRRYRKCKLFLQIHKQIYIYILQFTKEILNMGITVYITNVIL